MNNLKNHKLLLGSIAAGLVLGYIGGPVQILAIWAIAGLTIGYLSRAFRRAVVNGLLFGFVVSFVFMLHGYTGTDPVATKLVGFAALGLFGALCGIILALIGQLAHKMRRRVTP